MKSKMLFAILIMFSSFAMTAATSNLDEVKEVLKIVETKYDSEAIGDNGASWGILQIQKAAIDDVNRVCGTSYTHQDAFDVTAAEHIFELYIEIWSDKLEKREGRPATIEDMVRIWNGGPRGYKKRATDSYFAKFQEISYIYNMAKNQQKCLVNGKLGIITARYTHTVDVYLFKDKRQMCGVKTTGVKLLPKEKKPAPDASQLQLNFG